MVMRLLLLLAAIGLLVWWSGRRRRPVQDRSPAPPPAPGSPAAADEGLVLMYRCAHCGVHVPADQAVSGEPAVEATLRLHYCSAAHRQLGPGPGASGP